MPVMPTASSRVVLMPDARTTTPGPQASKVRRYRLARMRLLDRREVAADRHPHLLRAYD